MSDSPLRPNSSSLGPERRRLLRRLAARSWAPDTYLAGSAGLALYLEHRPVHNLDLMSGVLRLASAQRRDLLADLLEVDPEAKVETARDGFLNMRLGDNTGLRFYYYPYPLIDPEEEVEGLALASAMDLAQMKLGAIVSRGTRRDFFDFYLLSQRLGLQEILRRSEHKYGHVRDFPLQALKGLADLEQCAGEPMPKLSGSFTWQEVERWVQGEVRELARQRLGLEPDESPTDTVMPGDDRMESRA